MRCPRCCAGWRRWRLPRGPPDQDQRGGDARLHRGGGAPVRAAGAQTPYPGALHRVHAARRRPCLDRDQVLTGDEIRAEIEAVYPLEAEPREPSATARVYRFADGRGRIGFINPVSEPFCADCNRVRLTADGRLRTCLFSLNETDLRDADARRRRRRRARADHPRRGLAQGAQAPRRRAGLHPAGAQDVGHRRLTRRCGQLRSLTPQSSPRHHVSAAMLLLMLLRCRRSGDGDHACVLPVVPALLSASAPAVGGGRSGSCSGWRSRSRSRSWRSPSWSRGSGWPAAPRGPGDRRADRVRVVLLIPGLAERVQAPLSRLGRFGPKTRGNGFWSGLGVGGALGFVCAPCAGPILGCRDLGQRVERRLGPDRRSSRSPTRRARAVMLLYAFGGRAVLDRIRRAARGHVVERTLGVGAARSPACDGHQPRRPLRGDARQGHRPAGRLRRPDAVARELERGPEPARLAAPASRFAERQARPRRPGRRQLGVAIPGVKTPSLPVLGARPTSPKTRTGSTLRAAAR